MRKYLIIERCEFKNGLHHDRLDYLAVCDSLLNAYNLLAKERRRRVGDEMPSGQRAFVYTDKHCQPIKGTDILGRTEAKVIVSIREVPYVEE